VPRVMDEREGLEMVKRSWKSLLSSAALLSAFSAAGIAAAGDGCSEGCTTAGCPDCKSCEQIFNDAGQKLTDQLAKMSACGDGCGNNANCSAPQSVCDNGAADPCGDPLGDSCAEGCDSGLFGESGSGIEFGGWTQFGYQNNPDGSFTGNGVLLNQKEWDVLGLNQQGLYVGRAADGSKGLDFGFRAEAIYGTDGNEAQSFGNNFGRYDYDDSWNHGIYEWALPQLYAEVASGDLSVKLGHFYTPIGYEVIPSGGNFFFSRQITFYNSEPFTHTGALATYAAGDNLSVLGGWTLGMDTGFDQLNGGSAFLGGFIYTLSEATSLTYMMTTGNQGWRGDGSINSVILSHNWTDAVQSVHQIDVLNSDLDADFAVNGIARDSVGQINYLFYTINDQLKAGVRQEWFKADSISYNTVTYGVNIKPVDMLVIRPEVRHMFSPGAPAGAYDELFNSTVFGIDAILTY
ncbi:MAG: hypothetical protein RLZZ536_128, partial [Planctomycetota bacterium]